MSLVTRNPETGRFESTAKKAATPKAEKAKTTKKVAPKVKNQKGEMKVQLLVNPLAVYSKKSMEGNPSNIKTGTTVQLTEVEPNLIRVKKENSSRTFYTNQDAVLSASGK